MKRRSLIILVNLALFFLPTSRSNSQSFNPLLATLLQDSLSNYVAAITNVKGMSASVYLPGQGIWQGIAGESYTGQPITADMGFGIASNTKLFVATAILKLVDNHTISLDDSLSRWLPAYPNIDPHITIRQLLNHTSGIQDPIFLSPWMDTIIANPTRIFTPTEVVSWVGTPVFAAGTSWGYSNVNYTLAGMVAQSAAGMHISQIIRDSILAPLALDSTFYDVEEAGVGTIAHRWYNAIDYNDTSRVGLNTAGGCAGALFSTSRDMARWYNALMTGQVLSPASFAELTTFVNTFGPPYTYGLGLENQVWFGHTTYGHGGSTWGYKSKMVYDPCMGAVVCGLANSWPAGMDGITLILYRILVNTIPGCPGAITGPDTVCRQQNNVTYTITAIPNATAYVWTLPGGVTDTSSTNSIMVNYGLSSQSGSITVKGSNIYGDGNISTLQVIVNSVDVGVTATGTTISVDSSADSYQWLDCNNAYLPVAGETNQSYTAALSGNYAVEITKNGCIDTSLCIPVTTVGMSLLSEDQGQIIIYPNPFSSQTQILFHEEQENTTIKITDLPGKEIITATCTGKQLILEKGEMREGIYFVQITGKKRNTVNRKIVIQ